MNILGINFGHDAAVALIQKGEIKYAIEEEKISRLKQDFGWPENAVQEIFRQFKLSPFDIDRIAFGSFFFNELGANEIKYRFSKSEIRKHQEYLDRITHYFWNAGSSRFGEGNINIFEEEIYKRGYVRAKVSFHHHHLCHAASAFYCAPFQPDLTITCDGHGDGESFNFYSFEEQVGLVRIETNDYSTSIGAFYSAVTKLLGFRPTRHEGKITGLAAFGKHTTLVDAFNALFYLDEAGKLARFPGNQVEKYWKFYQLNEVIGLKEKINIESSESSIGKDYAMRFQILIEHLREITLGFSKEDIAYACQKATEKWITDETQRVIKKHFNGSKVKIGLAGGVFANVRINQKIFEMEEVENVFIQPAMGDSGLAIGAAILEDINNKNNFQYTNIYRFKDTYWGPSYDDRVESFINQIEGEAIITKMTQPAYEIAQILKDNFVVGFWHGRMEWGPRALGRRSMILNTFDRSVNDSVNKRLNRTEFMPFAPSVIDYKIKEYMPAYDENCPAADYMTITYDVAPKYHDQLQAVVHVDGTARPQIVKRDANPFFYDIIHEFHKLTGCGAIVNTSFNAHEEPIVNTPEIAYKALKENRIDVLVLNGYKIEIKP